MDGLKSTSPALHLDLNNFDYAEAQRSRYVLTSPRSLESCARLGIKPVELLIKSLNDLVAEQHDVPFEAVRVMHESYEKERMKLLQMCQRERERIIQRAGDRCPGSNKVSCLEVVPVSKLKDHSTDRQTSWSLPYADLCFKGKSLNTSSCSAVGNRDPDRGTLSSFSLGSLRHSQATEMELERLTKDINKKMCVTVSERDCKIAAIMLVKHQEEQARLKLCQQEEQERQWTYRQEEAWRAEAEKKRRKKLKQSMQRWHEELEYRRRLREHQAKEKAEQLKQEVLQQENRWRTLKEEVEAHRREKSEAAQKEAVGRKCYQEKLLKEKEEKEKREREREREIVKEKQQKARRNKMLQEKKESKRLQEENCRELLRHILLKQKVEQQIEEAKEKMRTALEKKVQHSCKNRARAVEARLRALQERAAREEEQVQKAQLRAKLHSTRKLTHKQILLQQSQRRIERAVLHASAQHRNRAQQTKQHNKHRQISHQKLREMMQIEEERMRRVRETYISMKEWRRERLRRQQEQIQNDAQRLARASFHMREKVRGQTNRRTFDQMALEAQLTSSMSHMKL
ncbi:Coiled-coil domain-containing protein 177 Myelin proteolipid protein-like protein [Channa argus]|uniref:Coiled-coil domain-containing protein 177 Myelin proteolipid protein-like protein n=1 Tax=Channa argus TaxID=215402 RepID=A0A6G1R0S9_CHAAH|nr:Coiled-coil domain-containing protein 177 Myelin proteolipid protein-like protein [Channa argus]